MRFNTRPSAKASRLSNRAIAKVLAGKAFSNANVARMMKDVPTHQIGDEVFAIERSTYRRATDSPANDCPIGISSIELMFTRAGKVATQNTVSATSSGWSGSAPA